MSASILLGDLKPVLLVLLVVEDVNDELKPAGLSLAVHPSANIVLDFEEFPGWQHRRALHLTLIK